MRKNRAVRRLIGVAAAATISVGVAAPAGLAQEADYGEETLLPAGGAGSGGTAGLTKAQLRKRCIAKAQTKFGDNRPKKKAAIRKCKKKYR